MQAIIVSRQSLLISQLFYSSVPLGPWLGQVQHVSLLFLFREMLTIIIKLDNSILNFFFKEVFSLLLTARLPSNPLRDCEKDSSYKLPRGNLPASECAHTQGERSSETTHTYEGRASCHPSLQAVLCS